MVSVTHVTYGMNHTEEKEIFSCIQQCTSKVVQLFCLAQSSLANLHQNCVGYKIWENVKIICMILDLK